MSLFIISFIYENALFVQNIHTRIGPVAEFTEKLADHKELFQLQLFSEILSHRIDMHLNE